MKKVFFKVTKNRLTMETVFWLNRGAFYNLGKALKLRSNTNYMYAMFGILFYMHTNFLLYSDS